MIKNFIRQHKGTHPNTIQNSHYQTINSNSRKNFALNSDLGDALNSGKLGVGGNIDLSGLAGKYETHQAHQAYGNNN